MQLEVEAEKATADKTRSRLISERRKGGEKALFRHDVESKRRGFNARASHN